MLRPALAVALAALAGCSLDFDLSQLRQGDAAPLTVTDASEVDVPTGSACGASGQPCCPPSAADASEGAGAAARCRGALVCSEGYCVPCPNGLTACGDRCVDLGVSVAHCGACGSPCADGQSCVGGTCTLDCFAPLRACDGRCAAVLTDPANCGACGSACAAANAAPRCMEGACVADCRPGFDDCDGAAANGCETDTRSSADHCGACGMRCALSNATAACAAGRCAVAACASGYGDCDGDASNGCETTLASSAQHCGACGRACADGQVCRAGTCVTTAVTCEAGRGNCDGLDANACEVDLGASREHCGRCGMACAPPNAVGACVGGQCRVGACMAGVGDCDGNPANGCETDTRSSNAHCGGCGVACARANGAAQCVMGVCALRSCDAGFGDCDGDPANGCEADTRGSVANCGGCGVRCAPAHAVGMCAMGACRVASCEAGWADCDGNPGNGCEVDTRSSAANCGACGRLCSLPNTTAACAGGVCGFAACAAGFGDCDRAAANGCETDVRASDAHCGACGRACGAGQRCVAGSCALTCPVGQTVCGGACANLMTDAANCGACGRACPSGQRCASGACVLTCPTGQAACGTACANLQTDAANCGACGRACPTGQSCVAGACALVCPAGQSACGGQCVDTRASLAHCGACGAACAAPANGTVACVAGTCTPTCSAGYADCDRAPANGCEAALTSNESCGACGVVCPSNGSAFHTSERSQCVMGRCTIACDPGYRDCDGVPNNGCETAGACPGEDAGVVDAGPPDAGTPDAGTPDAGTPDVGAPDVGTPDAGAPDVGTPSDDAGDAGTVSSDVVGD
ncbi:MAG: hypothetical protein R3A52_31355 [Polyangiales bacterium]